MADLAQHPFISLVLPVLNEEESLQELHRNITRSMDRLPNNYEIIFVDDGSTDHSFDIMKTIRQADNRVRVIQFRRNFGKSEAYSAGFKHARGDIIITMDADLQEDPDEIPLFIDKIQEGNDMVVGWRYSRKAEMDKTMPSKIFNLVVRFVTRISLHDFNCPFKAYRKEVLREIDIHGELHRYIPVLASSKGFTLAEIKIGNLPRKYGKSKYGAERYIRGMLDLLTVTFITRFAKRPLHLLGLGGLIVCALGFGVLAVLTGGHILYGLGILSDRSWNMHDRPMLSLGILLMLVGTQFFSLGLLGELFVTASNRSGSAEQGYSVKQILE